MNKRYPLIALLSALLLCTFLSADAQVTGPASNTIFTSISDSYLERLISAAKANYPRVKLLGHRVNAAKANYDKTKISWFDSFTFSYVYQPYNLNTVNINYTNPAYTYFNGLQVGLFFNLGTILEKPASIKQAKEELGQASNEQQEYMLQLELDVKTRYYTYVRSLESVKIANQAVIDAGNLAQDVRHKYEKTEETLENYLRAQVSLSQQVEIKVQAETTMLIAKASLEELIGDKLENIK